MGTLADSLTQSKHWQLTIIGTGLLFLLGGIFNWKWTWNPDVRQDRDLAGGVRLTGHFL